MRAKRNGKQIGLRLPEDLEQALEEAAAKSGWTVSEQIRYELMEPRGLWRPKQPYLPGSSGSGHDRPRRKKDAA